MFKLNELVFERCERNDIKSFIEMWHYSKSINGMKSSYCFCLKYSNNIVGALIIGNLAMHNQYKKYCENENDIMELRRLCCIDETPKNIESYFIGKAMKWMLKNTSIKYIVSYADPEYGHEGIIYKASNFDIRGRTSKGKIIVWNDKKYHDKTIRTKYKGELKPFAQKVKDALDRGEAYYKNTEGKYIYLYDLEKRR